jgi:hypothetical protein
MLTDRLRANFWHLYADVTWLGLRPAMLAVAGLRLFAGVLLAVWA